MGIGDKLKTIADNQERVYNAGFEKGTVYGHAYGEHIGYSRGYEEGYDSGFSKGKLSILEQSQYMSRQVTGHSIYANDVSPIQHNMAVSVFAPAATVFSETIEIEGPGGGGLGYGIANLIFIEGKEYQIKANGVLYKYTGYVDEGGYYCLGERESGIYPFEFAYDTYDQTYCLYWIGNEKKVEFAIYEPEEDMTSVKVKRYGKNLFEHNPDNLQVVKYTSLSTGAVSERMGYSIYLPAGTYTVHAEKAQEYTSGCFIYHNAVDKDGNTIKSLGGSNYSHPVANTELKTVTFTIDQDFYYIIYNANAHLDKTSTQQIFDKFNIQLEVGGAATPYEEYIMEEFDSDEEGKLTIPSISPNMFLYVERETANIDCLYFADIDSFINNLTINIATTGGI